MPHCYSRSRHGRFESEFGSITILDAGCDLRSDHTSVAFPAGLKTISLDAIAVDDLPAERDQVSHNASVFIQIA